MRFDKLVYGGKNLVDNISSINMYYIANSLHTDEQSDALFRPGQYKFRLPCDIPLHASSSIVRVLMCLPLPYRECTNSHSSKNHQLKALRQLDPESNRGRQTNDLVIPLLRVDVECQCFLVILGFP